MQHNDITTSNSLRVNFMLQNFVLLRTRWEEGMR